MRALLDLDRSVAAARLGMVSGFERDKRVESSESVNPKEVEGEPSSREALGRACRLTSTLWEIDEGMRERSAGMDRVRLGR